MTTRNLRIATDPAGHGQGGWWWVRIHDTPEQLRDAAHRHHGWYGRAHWDGVYGCCQPAPYRERVTGSGHWEMVPPHNRQLGVIRLCRPFTYEQAIHELGHAALATYRFTVKRGVNLGTECGPREEALCYILGELADSFLAQV